MILETDSLAIGPGRALVYIVDGAPPILKVVISSRENLHIAYADVELELVDKDGNRLAVAPANDKREPLYGGAYGRGSTSTGKYTYNNRSGNVPHSISISWKGFREKASFHESKIMRAIVEEQSKP